MAKVLKVGTTEVTVAIQEKAFVLFTQDMCIPCQSVAEKISEMETSKAVVHSIDVREHPELAETCKVLAVPTLIRFENGKEVLRVEGDQGSLIRTLLLK